MKTARKRAIPIAVVALLSLAALSARGDEMRKARLGDWGVDLTARMPDVRPQDDFFRHANGTWLDEFEIPEDLPAYGSFTKLALEAEEHVREIIDDVAEAGGKPGSNEQKIADLFNDYLDDAAREKAGLEPLAGELARIRAASSHEEIAKLLGRYGRTGGPSLFGMWIDQDSKDPTRYIVWTFQGGLGLPDRDYYLDEENARFANAREVYRGYLSKMLGLAGLDDTEARAERLFLMEKALAEAHWPAAETRDVEKTYNKMTQAEVRKLAPGFGWSGYWSNLGIGKSAPELIVMNPSAFTGMARVFEGTPVAVWQDWLTYRLLRNNAEFLGDEIDETHFRFVSEAITGAKERRERWKRGVQFVNSAMGEAVGKIYVERYFSAEAKRRMDELVDNLIVAMGERIDGLDWMSDDTKVEARDKLAKFAVKIGYPDEWRDYSGLEVRPGDLLGNAWRADEFEHEFQIGKLGKPVDRNEWFMSPQTVNAYYNSNMNEIVFPAAILQPPFFDEFADDAVNYGGIGAVIGHEIGHGFDDQGRKSDGDGVLRDWWSEEDAAKFKQRADMLVEQYNAYSPLEGMNVNGELTLGENIGDLGGIELAYHAYHLSLHGKRPPVIDGLTGDQRFFLSWSQIWRGKLRDELMATILASNPHSPNEFRVNGSVRNVDAWYAAFDVKPGDALYLDPAERVRIW